MHLLSEVLTKRRTAGPGLLCYLAPYSVRMSNLCQGVDSAVNPQVSTVIRWPSFLFSMDRGRIYPTMPPDPGCLQTVVHKSFPSHLRTTLLLATATAMVMTTTTATQVLSLSRARALLTAARQSASYYK